MAKRYFPDDIEHQGCSCSVVQNHTEDSAYMISCKKNCVQTIAVPKLESRRICIDFGSCDWTAGNCGDCPEWALSKAPMSWKANPPDCPESDGKIGLDGMIFDEKSGKLWLTVDAFDMGLQNGERFRMNYWMEMPDSTIRMIEFFITIGGR